MSFVGYAMVVATDAVRRRKVEVLMMSGQTGRCGGMKDVRALLRISRSVSNKLLCQCGLAVKK